MHAGFLVLIMHLLLLNKSNKMHLKKKVLNKYEIGREEFLKHCWEWKEKYGGIIFSSLKKLGVSCDWERERFTMDDHYYSQVIKTFVDLYNEGKFTAASEWLTGILLQNLLSVMKK
jgi:valyl-tRNA synthetase